MSGGVGISPPAGSGGGVRAWYMDWQTRTANSQADADVQDGGKSNVQYGGQWAASPPGRWLTVLSASGLGFPAGMTNVLRVELGASTVSQMLGIEGLWNTIADGGSIYFRYYQRVDFANGFDTGSMHHIQHDGHGTIGSEWKILTGVSGHVSFRLHAPPSDSNGAYDIKNTGAAVMNRTSVYRIEWHWTRSGSNLAVEVRIYDSTDTLIATGADFLSANFGTPLTANNSLTPYTAATVQKLEVGNNGPNLSGRDHSEYMYLAGFAVSFGDWLGSWNATYH